MAIPGEQLLLKLGLDLGPMKQAGEAVKAILTAMNKLNDEAVAKSAASAKSTQKALNDMHVAMAAMLVEAGKQELAAKAKTAALEEGAKAAKKAAEEEKVRTQAQKTAAELTKKALIDRKILETEAAVAAKKAETAHRQAEEAKKLAHKDELHALDKELALLRQQTQELQKQAAELRLRKMQESGAASAAAGAKSHGLGTGLGHAVVGGLLGRGLAGSVAGGVIAGEGISLILQKVMHGIEGLIHKIKHLTLESANLSKVQDQFEKLARGAGVDAAEAMEHLTHATEGEVSKLDLLKLGVAGLNSTAKITPERLADAAGAAFKLAEAAGKGGQAGINALNRALLTGQVRSLAMATGINAAQFKISGFTAGLSAAERTSKQFNQAIEVMEKKLKALGETPDTLEDAELRISKAKEGLFMGFGKGFIESGGAASIVGMLNKLADDMRHGAEWAEKFGHKVGDAFARLGPVLLTISSILGAVLDTVGELVGAFTGLFGLVADGSKSTGDKVRAWGDALAYIVAMVHGLKEAVLGLTQYIGTIIMTVVSGVGVLLGLSDALRGKGLATSKKALDYAKEQWRVLEESIERRSKESEGSLARLLDSMNKIAEASEKGYKSRGKVDPAGGGDELTAQQRLKLESERVAKMKAQAQERLTELQNEYAEEKRIADLAYRDGEVSIDTHLETLQSLAMKGYTAKLQQAAESYNLDLNLLKKRLAEGAIAQRDYNEKQAEALSNYNTQIRNLHAAALRELHGIDDQGRADRRQARRKDIDETAADEKRELDSSLRHYQRMQQAQREALQAEASANERKLSRGELSPDAYFEIQANNARRLSDIEIQEAERLEQHKIALANADLKRASDTYEVDKKNLNAKKTFEDARAKIEDTLRDARLEKDDKVTRARMRLEETLTRNQEAEFQKRMQFIQQEADARTRPLETLLSIKQGLGPGQQFGTAERDIILRIQQELKEERNKLQAELQRPNLGQREWSQIYDEMLRVTQQQERYNQLLREMPGHLELVASSLGALAQVADKVFGSNFARGMFSAVQSGVKTIQDASKQFEIISGVKSKDPVIAKLETEAGMLFSKVRLAGDPLANSFSKLTIVAVNLGTALAKISQISNNRSGLGFTAGYEDLVEGDRSIGIERPQNVPGTDAFIDKMGRFTDKVVAGAAALGGFVSSITAARSAIGGGLGGGIAGAGLGGQLGGMLKSLGGPAGMAIGATVGVVAGVIVGAKQAAVKRQVDKLNESFKQVMDEFSKNTDNLNTTIAKLEILVQQAQAMKDSSKKGSAQFQQAIDQYNQQIMQLKTQQEDVIRNLHEQLALLQMPANAQDLLGGLQQIIKTFNQFAGAASTVEELAQAMEYLDKATANYELNLQNEWASANEGAINNALKLNDLLERRKDLVANLGEQIQSVLAAGSATRQATRAQLAGAQIYQIQRDAQRQMETLNREIAATQYRLDNERQVFDLASTRVGLEMQLLSLQNRQTDLDMQRINALQQLLAGLQSGDYGPLKDLLAAYEPVSVLGGGASERNAERLRAQSIIQGANSGFGDFDQSEMDWAWRILNGGTDVIGSSVSGTDILTALIKAAYSNRGSLGFARYKGGTTP